MSRSILAIAPLVLFMSGCVPDVDIIRNTTMSGHLKVKTFHVAPNVTVSAPGDLVVESLGRVSIEGRVRGEIGSGANIEIRVSSGDLAVDGALEAGSGADGEAPGEDGEPGGSVRLRADRGAIVARGALAAGAGGDGAGRREQGRGDLRVVSGAGGRGGDVVIAGASVVLDSGVAAGDGGEGGSATARIMSFAAGAPIVDCGLDAADPRKIADDEQLPAEGSADASSAAGGNGGSVQIAAAALQSPREALRAGSGGAVSRAVARGGVAASASLAKPGAGGDVSLRVAGLTSAASAWNLVPGDGGDAGRPGEITAHASAHAAASAATLGGGEAGKVLLGAAASGTGAGGDGGGVLAQTDKGAKYALGGEAHGAAPGKPAAARAP